ncbi:hypothetical protein C5167_046716 [Papaver somniferum]|uniref:Uncharacterized protein n=1 Tax=Papaver somniferum TaxID=3469 RepID=A0A4Y7LHD3_PAPSO|nr:hypothetical protein C5167_046716 [Papaver somniferum]
MKKSKILERFLYFTRVLRFLKPNQVSDDYTLVFFQREPPVSDDSVACISGCKLRDGIMDLIRASFSEDEDMDGEVSPSCFEDTMVKSYLHVLKLYGCKACSRNMG